MDDNDEIDFALYILDKIIDEENNKIDENIKQLNKIKFKLDKLQTELIKMIEELQTKN